MGSGILVLNQPGVYLVDADGNVVTIADGGTIGDSEAIILAGKDGSVARMVKVSSASRLVTDGSEVTQPISAAALPLPSGAATEATLASRATETTLQAADTKLGTIDSVLDSIKDTDGIKKITDQLPAGTNEIGKVAQGTKAVGSDGWPTVLYDASGSAVGVVLDGGVYRLRAETKIVRASDGAQINPSREETLVAIKDTDGIKKITDQLPAGTNEVGFVGQGTKATPANAWPFYLVDGSGNIVGVVADGVVYRLQADAKISKGASDLVHLDAIDTAAGRGRLKTTLYTADGDPVAFPSSSRSIKNEFVTYSSSSSLLVDGSVTPVVFSYAADSTYDISLQEIKFTLVSNSVSFGSGYFGATSGPLTNGLLLEVVTDGNTVTLYNFQQNESFVNFASPGGFEWVVSSKDLMSSNYLIGGGLKLHAGTSDVVRVTVRDDIDAAGVYFRCFVKGNLLGA